MNPTLNIYLNNWSLVDWVKRKFRTIKSAFSPFSTHNCTMTIIKNMLKQVNIIKFMTIVKVFYFLICLDYLNVENFQKAIVTEEWNIEKCVHSWGIIAFTNSFLYAVGMLIVFIHKWASVRLNKRATMLSNPIRTFHNMSLHLYVSVLFLSFFYVCFVLLCFFFLFLSYFNLL